MGDLLAQTANIAAGQRQFCLVALVNRPDILAANLLLSPDIISGRLPLLIEEGAANAGIGLNRLVDRAAEDYPEADVIIAVHQDVYLPNGWADTLAEQLADLDEHDPNWAVAGAFGNAPDGAPWGPVWSSSLSAIVGRVSARPVAVEGFDELLLILRRSSGLRFDETMPGFHLYGTDIAQQAIRSGRGAWVIPLPLVHNDRFHEAPDETFTQAYHHMRRKWRPVLPLTSSVITISWHGLHLTRTRWRDRRSAGQRREVAQDNSVDPRIYAKRCGWEYV